MTSGIRGSATISLNIMGHGLNFGVSIAANTGAVDTARAITDKFLSLGLEATDVPPIPGVPPALGDAPASTQAAHALSRTLSARVSTVPAASTATPPPISAGALPQPGLPANPPPPVPVTAFLTPDYTVFAIAPKKPTDLRYFLLLPSANRKAPDPTRLGFLPPPPDDTKTPGPSDAFPADLPLSSAGEARESRCAAAPASLSRAPVSPPDRRASRRRDARRLRSGAEVRHATLETRPGDARKNASAVYR